MIRIDANEIIASTDLMHTYRIPCVLFTVLRRYSDALRIHNIIQVYDTECIIVNISSSGNDLLISAIPKCIYDAERTLAFRCGMVDQRFFSPKPFRKTHPPK